MTPLVVRLGSWSNLRKFAVLHYHCANATLQSHLQHTQGLQMPTPVSEYSLTSTLNVSPVVTDASSDSLGEERTVQMTFVDHVSDPDSLKTGTPPVMRARAGLCGRIRVIDSHFHPDNAWRLRLFRMRSWEIDEIHLP
jgi:hypothetical protein